MTQTTIRTNEEWKYWGKTDPLFGVLSDPRKRKGGASPWTESEFYKVGEEHWQALWPHWNAYGAIRDSCLEIGCGAGRMTRQLAQTFAKVIAVDVSEEMLVVAQSKSLPNVEYHLTNGIDIPVPRQSVSAAFSMHVLQHLGSVELQMGYLREIFSIMKPGGTMFVHMPIYKLPFLGQRVGSLYQIFWRKRKAVNCFKRMLLRFGMNAHVMEMTEISVQQVFDGLTKIGFENLDIRFIPTHSNTQIHPCILGRKPKT